MIYEVGKNYEFHNAGLYVGSDGNKYLKVIDDEHNIFSVKPYQFQLDWNDMTKRVRCFLAKIVEGRPRFELHRDSILDYWYANHIGKFNTFVIERKCIDSQSGSTYFLISDCYGIGQRFYPNDEEFVNAHNEGDEIELTVNAIRYSKEGKNNAHLDLSIRGSEQQNNRTLPAASDTVEKTIHNEEMRSIGEENETTEFKSSIAYTSNGAGPDVKAQLAILMKTVAGFMNKEGGKLYIGVNDAGEPYRDISQDYKYLNNDDSDNFIYHENFDHYKLKIQNAIKRILGDTFATTLVTINKLTENGVDYAEVCVAKSSTPIWYEKTELYVRCDNSTRRLMGDAITKFILHNTSTVEPASVGIDVDSVPWDAAEDALKTIEVEPAVASAQTDGVWRYVAFFSDGSWEFCKNANSSNECVVNVPVPKNPKTYNMVLAYEDGHVNVVKLKNALYGSGAKKNTLIAVNVRHNNGLSMDCGRLVSAFCCKPKDSLLIESECDGILRIKAHRLSDVSSRDNFAGAKGQLIVPNGSKLVRMTSLDNDSAALNAIESMGLMALSYQKYQRNGVTKAHLDGRYISVIDDIFAVC